MLPYIPSAEALERFKKECKLKEQTLLNGKCQLCIDALLLMTPVCVSSSSYFASTRYIEEISLNVETPFSAFADSYLVDLIRRCPSIKLVYPSNIQFNGYVDLSLLESCSALELVRIPFNCLTGTENLRNRLRSLTWLRGHSDSEDSTDETDSNMFKVSTIEKYDQQPLNFKSKRINEIFWDEFGTWPLLTFLCISQSSICHINASSMPYSIKTLDLRMNRICDFCNTANYSLTSTITKLCLDFNSLKELPKLNDNTCTTLIHLSLRGNLIESLSGLRNFTSLDYLDLSENSICDIKHLLAELVCLSKTLKTFYINGNPVSYHRDIFKKCQQVLNNMTRFNGKFIKPNSRQLDLTPLLLDCDLAHQSLLDDLTVEDNAVDIQDNIKLIPEVESNPDTTLRKFRSKPSKERFVVISDNDIIDHNNKPVIIEDELFINSSIHSKENHKNVKTFDKGKYFFGAVSASYESFNQTTPNSSLIETNPFLNENSQHSIETVKGKLLQKRKELGDEWLISEKDKSQTNKPGLDNEVSVEHILEENINDNKLIVDNVNFDYFDESSEWIDEDTNDENTIFLVEVYSSEADYLNCIRDDSNNNYFFLRVRPTDGLLFEKDCTSGKVLTTMDLKILKRYEFVKKTDSEITTDSTNVVRLLFETAIASKRERIYRFLETDSCHSFIKLYLDDISKFKAKNDFDSTNLPNNGNVTEPTKLLSTTPNSKDLNFSWFYMCLRCGHRTHRIITDCSKCGSDLIIKDEGNSANNNPKFSNSKSSSKQLSSSIKQSLSGVIAELDDNNSESSLTNKECINPNSNGKIDCSLLSEDDIASIDSNYFTSNIDHNLKLHIEIYIYNQIGDTLLKSESIEALCNCVVYNFSSQTFTSSLLAFTENYLFLFDYFDVDGKDEEDNSNNKRYRTDSALLSNSVDSNNTYKSKNHQKDIVKLRFYRPMNGPKAPQFIISHLPGQLKNQGYWLECKSIDNKAKSKQRRKKSKSPYELQLILFGDQQIGKAFLELFLHSHRACTRSQTNAAEINDLNLVLIKTSITELTHSEDGEELLQDEKSKRRIMLKFDEPCLELIGGSNLNGEKLSFCPTTSTPLNSLVDHPLDFTVDATTLYFVRSFKFLQNIQNRTGSFSTSKDTTNDLFTLNENIALLITKHHIILTELLCHFETIASSLNLNKSESMAKVIQTSANFSDQIEIKMLFKESVINLQNIYIDKSKSLLVLRFREDENFENMSSQKLDARSNSFYKSDSDAHTSVGWVVCEFHIQFITDHTLKQACKLIQSLWEDNFGVSLTISKYLD